MKDRITLGALAGLGAVLTRDVYGLLARAVGFTKFLTWNVAADLFIHGQDIFRPLGIVLGFVADLTLGAIIGALFVYLLKLSGHRNPMIKGLGFGLGAWLLLFGIMVRILPDSPKVFDDVLSNLNSFVGHAVFGLSLGYYADRLLNHFKPDRSPMGAGG